ncbi:MAG: hypothetical protein ACKV2Q_29595 [Planctomycetaceae bacterium]
MTNPERDDVFQVLRELCEHCPDVRFGQLIVNLSYLARGMAHESIWDMDDEELIQAATKQLETLRSREAVTV